MRLDEYDKSAVTRTFLDEAGKDRNIRIAERLRRRNRETRNVKVCCDWRVVPEAVRQTAFAVALGFGFSSVALEV